jgi:uncharacterized protein
MRSSIRGRGLAISVLVALFAISCGEGGGSSSSAPVAEGAATSVTTSPRSLASAVSYGDCLDLAGSLDAAKGPALCEMLYPALGLDSESPITGPTDYVEMPDGTIIATVIRMPKAHVAGSRHPVVIEISGYESGSDDGRTPLGDFAAATGIALPLQTGSRGAHGKYYEDEFVSITASVRGTGCSSGEFDLFSERSTMDGHHLVEWAARQPWSNGDVGLFGHSYSGITAALVAATRPPSLRVLSISGLIGDLYRDIVYPGGVSNYGFPLLWTGGVRLLYDVGGGTLAGLLADSGDRRCLRNQAARSRTIAEDPILNGLQDWDGPWYQTRSIVPRADRITVPTHVTSAYQDEQTGPRGGTNVFDHLDPSMPRRLVLLNGDHDSQAQLAETIAERKAWLDQWLLGRTNPFVDVERTPESVRVLLEVHRFGDGERSNGEIVSDDFPLPETEWTDWFLGDAGALAPDGPGADGGSTTYLHGTKRQAYAYQAGVDTLGELTAVPGPDEASFRSEPFAETLVVAGPILATLFVRALPVDLQLPIPTDLELMVQILDEGPGGELIYLQRGLLRASHREIDFERSDDDREGRLYRPFRPHRGPLPELIPAGETVELLVEVFPLGHVFRPGHRLVVKVHAPTLDDNDWIYVPKSPPTLATILHDAEHPSRVTMPVIPLADVDRLGPDLGSCASARVRCVTPGGSLPTAEDVFGSVF